MMDSDEVKKKPGRKGVPSEAVFREADAIWQGGRGPKPTIAAVRARLGTGSTARLSQLLKIWEGRRLGEPDTTCTPLPNAEEPAGRRLDVHDAAEKCEAAFEAGHFETCPLTKRLADRLKLIEAARVEVEAQRDEALQRGMELEMKLEEVTAQRDRALKDASKRRLTNLGTETEIED